MSAYNWFMLILVVIVSLVATVAFFKDIVRDKEGK